MSTRSLDSMTTRAEAGADAAPLASPKGSHDDVSDNTPTHTHTGPDVPAVTTDVEKTAVEKGANGDAPAKPQMPSFPDGGLMAWMAVAGSWLVSE
jgi:hypothetical protein